MNRLLHSTVALCAALSVACASTDDETGTSQPGAPDGSMSVGRVCEGGICQPRRRLVTVTIGRVVELPSTESGYGADYVDVGGATVCADRCRPRGGTWEDFGPCAAIKPCTTSVEGERIVIPELPEQSEILVTVEKEGFVSSVFAITIGNGTDDEYDLDTNAAWEAPLLLLVREDAPASIPTDRQLASEGTGSLSVFAVICAIGSVNCIHVSALGGLAGASFSIDGRNDEAFYSVSGQFRPNQTETEGSTLADPDSYEKGVSVRELADLMTVGTFVDLPENEYRVRVEHPRARCDLAGWQVGASYQGFRDGADTIRVPVLAGYTSPRNAFFCGCDASDRVADPSYVDPLSCSGPIYDAGAE